MQTSKLDILIVGAGPAGMTLAAALVKHKVPFRIIDKDDGPTDETRAPVLWQRTQEILAAIGIRDRWLPQSIELREESLHFYEKAAGANPLAAPNSPYPKALFCEQSTTEHILNTFLSEQGHDVEYGMEVISYEEMPDHAQVMLRTKDGDTECIEASWVVSAEGSHSVIRHAAGLDFEGEKYLGFRIHVADVNASWTLATPAGQTIFYVGERWYMGGQRLPGPPDRFYFYILTPDERPEDDSNELSLEEVQKLVRRFSGDAEATLSEPRWLNTARYRHGVADSYRRGRALLIGDAARSSPPLYGQGMNCAMHDAWNLSWKLAYVTKGSASRELLDTFASERHKLGAELDRRIDRTFKFITQPKPFQASVVRNLAPGLLSSEYIQNLFGENLTEMSLTYDGVGLNQQSFSQGNLRSGERAPALWVKSLPDCSLLNLLDLYDGLRWTLLVISSSQDWDEVQPNLRAAQNLQRSLPDTLECVYLSCGPQRPEKAGVRTLIDAEARFMRDHSLKTPTILLIRPDGYLAWITQSIDEDLQRYVERWLSCEVPHDVLER